MDLPFHLLAPTAGTLGLLACFGFHRRSALLPNGSENQADIDQRTEQELGATSRVLARTSLALLGPAFVGLLLMYFGGVGSAAIPPAVFLGGLLSAAISYQSARLCARAQTSAATQPGDQSSAPGRTVLNTAATIGLGSTALALLFVSLAYIAMTGLFRTLSLEQSTSLMAAFGFGMCLQSLLSQLAGGVVGRAERLLDSDDPDRRSGEVACAVSEEVDSYTTSLLLSLHLGVAAAVSLAPTDTAAHGLAALLPTAVAGLGLLICVGGLWRWTRTQNSDPPQDTDRQLHRVSVGSALAVGVGSGALCYLLLKGLTFPAPLDWSRAWASTALGQLLGLLALSVKGPSIQQSPPPSDDPMLEDAAARLFSGWTLPLLLGATALLSFHVSGGARSLELGFFGLSLTAVGFLATSPLTIAGSVLGPLASATGSPSPDLTSDRIAASRSHSMIGSALTALCLLIAYGAQLKSQLAELASRGGDVLVWGAHDVDEVALRELNLAELMNLYSLHAANPSLILGWLTGAAAVLLLSSVAVQQTAREALARKDSLERSSPDEAGARAGKRLLLPIALVCVLPLTLGVVLGPAATMGFSLGALCSGLPLAYLFAGSRWALGAWEPSGSVDSPLREAAARILGVGLKLAALTALVFAGLTVRWAPLIAESLGLF